MYQINDGSIILQEKIKGSEIWVMSYSLKSQVYSGQGLWEMRVIAKSNHLQQVKISLKNLPVTQFALLSLQVWVLCDRHPIHDQGLPQPGWNPKPRPPHQGPAHNQQTHQSQQAGSQRNLPSQEPPSWGKGWHEPKVADEGHGTPAPLTERCGGRVPPSRGRQ